MQRLLQFLDHLRLSLEDEHVRPPDRGHVERLVARVQDENVLHLGRNVADGPLASPSGPD